MNAASGIAQLSAWCVAVGLAGHAGEPGQSTAALSLDEQVAALEPLWKAGVGAREYRYYAEAGKLVVAMSAEQQAIGNKSALTVLGRVLSKRARPSTDDEARFEVGEADLGAMAKLADYLLSNDVVSAGVRQQKAVLLAKVLGSARSESVENYVPRPVTANVPLPPGVSGFIGMNPAAISDPVGREKYAAAIRENRLHNLMNKRQSALQAMRTQLTGPIIEYVRRVAKADPAAADIVRQAMVDARLSEEEKALVML